MTKCPPCNHDCNQGRTCPARTYARGTQERKDAAFFPLSDYEPDEDGSPRRIDPLGPATGFVVSIMLTAFIVCVVWAAVIVTRYM